MANEGTNKQSDVVIDRGASAWSDLWKKEYYWAIWIGFSSLDIGIVDFSSPPPGGYEG